MPAFREEVLNVLLAEALGHRGLLSLPETIVRAARRHGGRLPDVTIADLHGVRIVIEGRFNSGAGVPVSLSKDAANRVAEGIAPICLAVLYPPRIRAAGSLKDLRSALERARLRVRVFSEGSKGDWSEASVDDIAELLRQSYELLVTEDVVAGAAVDLSLAIDEASASIALAPAAPARLRKLLGIPEETDPAEDLPED